MILHHGVFFLLYYLPTWGIIYSSTIAFNFKVYKMLYMSISLHPRNILCNIQQQVTKSRTIATCTSNFSWSSWNVFLRIPKTLSTKTFPSCVFLLYNLSRMLCSSSLHGIMIQSIKGYPYPQTNKKGCHLGKLFLDWTIYGIVLMHRDPIFEEPINHWHFQVLPQTN